MKPTDVFEEQVKRELRNLVPAGDFLKELRSSLEEFRRDHPDCTLEDIIEQFGKPEDVAREYIESTGANEPEKIAGQKRLRNIIIALLAVAVVAVGIYLYDRYMETHQGGATDVLIIYDEEPVDDKAE